MLENLKKLLAEELQIDPETVTLDAELTSDLGLNSIELADLVMLCEEKFGVTIDDDDILPPEDIDLVEDSDNDEL